MSLASHGAMKSGRVNMSGRVSRPRQNALLLQTRSAWVGNAYTTDENMEIKSHRHRKTQLDLIKMTTFVALWFFFLDVWRADIR